MTFQIDVIDGNGDSLGLPEHFLKLPLTALRVSARRVIELYLNEPSEIVDEETGYVNDYNGLAKFVGFSYLEIQHFGRQNSPTKVLLEEWETRNDLQEPSTVGKLWEGLLVLGRFDVMKDCQLATVKDVESFLKNKERQEDMIRPDDHDVFPILCRGDVENNTPQFFDAFVSYNHEGEDLNFVKDMIQTLEGEPHKLKLFIPERDGLPGASKYEIEAQLIELRCRKMIIILSHNYLQSTACEFQSKFAFALSPGARSKKLIPVIIKPMREIPAILRFVTLCDYTKVDLQDWFWNRLSSAIQQPLDPATSGYGGGSSMYCNSSGSMTSRASSRGYGQASPISCTSSGSLTSRASSRGYGQASSIYCTSSGSMSSTASSPDSAIGQSLPSSLDIRMEISSATFDDIASEWVDLSSDFSEHELQMSLSLSPPTVTSLSARNASHSVFEKQKEESGSATGPSSSEQKQDLKRRLLDGFEKFTSATFRGSRKSAKIIDVYSDDGGQS